MIHFYYRNFAVKVGVEDFDYCEGFIPRVGDTLVYEGKSGKVTDVIVNYEENKFEIVFG